MNERFKGRSSLATRGRFFLILISIFSWSELFCAIVPDDHENKKESMSDSLKLFNSSGQNSPAQIYVIGGAQLTDLENTISSPVVVIVKDNKDEISKKKPKDKTQKKPEAKKSIKKIIHKQEPISNFYFTNPQDKEFNHFDVGLDRAVITTTHQIKLFSMNKLFILSFVLFMSIYLMCFFRENTFFISLIGKNFQRPPPYSSRQLF